MRLCCFSGWPARALPWHYGGARRGTRAGRHQQSPRLQGFRIAAAWTSLPFPRPPQRRRGIRESLPRKPTSPEGKARAPGESCLRPRFLGRARPCRKRSPELTTELTSSSFCTPSSLRTCLGRSGAFFPAGIPLRGIKQTLFVPELPLRDDTGDLAQASTALSGGDSAALLGQRVLRRPQRRGQC